MYRIGFTGVPSTGKSTLARALSCSMLSKRVELVPEYARRFINKYGFRTLHDQFRILYKQLDWEDTVPKEKTDILITEAPIFQGIAYATLSEPKDEYDVMVLNDIYKLMNKLNFPRRYDVIFHLEPVIKPVDDGTRAKEQFDDKWRNQMNERIVSVFTLFPPKNFIKIKIEDLDNRVSLCKEHLRRLEIIK